MQVAAHKKAQVCCLQQILQQKFDEFLSEVAAYEEHIEHINQTSDTLTASGHSESPRIQKEQQHVNYLWMELKDLASGRLEVNAFLEYRLQIIFCHKLIFRVSYYLKNQLREFCPIFITDVFD